jgi:hypothetical protein
VYKNLNSFTCNSFRASDGLGFKRSGRHRYACPARSDHHDRVHRPLRTAGRSAPSEAPCHRRRGPPPHLCAHGARGTRRRKGARCVSKYTVRRGLWGSRINTHTRARARGATACGDHRFRSTRQLTGRHAGGGEFVRKSLLPCILCFHACYRCGSPGLLDGFLLFDGCSSSLCFIFSRPIDRRRNRRVEEARQVHISRAQQKCGRKEHVGASSWSLMNHRPGNRNPGFDMNRRRAADAEGMACATRHGKCCERHRIRIATNDADGGSD